ncbi:MAG: nicotinate-nicotinamide nucleotide adenylyltransferase [Alphaproteobacteria bacterium]|nr:nicotinate-nicotinamide nucleotide adenylyltransferase [Alphaproteobacteria bacterium]
MFTQPHLLNGPRWKNARVGLLGGSFNPPHEGHLHISLAAMKGLHLDAVWWLVSPKNPIKEIDPLPLQERVALCEKLVDHPNILISDIEKELNTTITYYSIKKLRTYYPHTQFVWISGMDNALGLHRWHHWKDLLGEICMVHLTRNPARSLVSACPLRMYEKQKHVIIDKGGQYPLDSGTTYWMMQKKMVNISSTEIRNKRLKSNKK